MSATDAAGRIITAIDCHAHVMRRDLPLASERHSAPKRDVTVEEYVATLDAHGVSHGVLTAPSFYGTDNSLLLAALEAFPERLRGTVIVAPEVDSTTLASMNQRGVVGVRLNWVRRAVVPDVTSPPYRQLFATLREFEWHVEIFLEGLKLSAVLPRIRASGVKVVVDHFAAPDPALGATDPGFREALRGIAAGDTWVKLSAPYRLGSVDPQRYVDALLTAGGRGQLVWASDWPFVSHEEQITYRQCVDWLASWIEDEATRRAILVETPAKLFRFARGARNRSNAAATFRT